MLVFDLIYREFLDRRFGCSGMHCDKKEAWELKKLVKIKKNKNGFMF